jgi:hypothetical protein
MICIHRHRARLLISRCDNKNVQARMSDLLCYEQPDGAHRVLAFIDGADTKEFPITATCPQEKFLSLHAEDRRR